MVSTINFINSRKLTSDEVNKINYIIKSRSKESVAAGRDEWLYPEKSITCDWADLRHVLLPPSKELYQFGGEMFAKFDDGTVHYQDAFGRTTEDSGLLKKSTSEEKLGRNDLCGCGSGLKYKVCCSKIPADLRTTWDVASIRERNLAFCDCIKDVLGLTKGKTWLDVRRELSGEQIKVIYSFYSMLWPSEADIYTLLPKSDGKFRGLYSGVLDFRTIRSNALPMSSFFDEFLIGTPIVNPNNVKPEFSPIKSPERYKYQALKDFLFMLDLEPFIGLGLVNIIPDPSEFDLDLKRAMLHMAESRGFKGNNLCQKDIRLHTALTTEDLLNSTAMMPREVRIEFLVVELGLDKLIAEDLIEEHEKAAETSPLSLLQKSPSDRSGQFMHFSMLPNYEMALFIAQVTGSILITDSGSRWEQLISAQHRDMGIVTYPWNEVFSRIDKIPIDERFLDTAEKSQGNFSSARNLLKAAHRMLCDNNRDTSKLTLMASQTLKYTESLNLLSERFILKKLKILSPNGGFYDANVQRLLARSSCLRYDNQVRSVYGLDLPD